MKKRKLNSKNPKYWSKEKAEGPKIKKKVLTKSKGVCKIYAVWYED